jgi:hypothetical protein
MGAVRRWLVVVAVVWGLAIAGLGYYSMRTGRATAREQTSIGSALPVVDAALADVASTLDPSTTVAALSGYVELSHDCRITAIRDGARYERVLVVYTREGSEAAVLEQVAARLPARYHARVSRSTKPPMLFADAGNFVLVQGGVAGAGQVRVSADTGCRPLDAPVREPDTEAPSTDRAPVQAVLDSLHLRPERWRAHRVTCPRGGALWTVEAVTAAGTAPAKLPTALDGVTRGAAVVLARNDVYAYRTGTAAVAVRLANGSLNVTSTVGCG